MVFLIESSSVSNLNLTDHQLYKLIDQLLSLLSSSINSTTTDAISIEFINEKSELFNKIKESRGDIYSNLHSHSLEETIAMASNNDHLIRKISWLEHELEKIQGKPKTISLSIPQTRLPNP